MNKKLYIIRSEDIFKAFAEKRLPTESLLQVGTIWATVSLNEAEKNNYPYPISDY